MSKSKAEKTRRKDRSRDGGTAALASHPTVTTVRTLLKNKKERRIFLLLTIPVLLAQYFFWSWMGWSAIIMVP